MASAGMNKPWVLLAALSPRIMKLGSPSVKCANSQNERKRGQCRNPTVLKVDLGFE